MEFVAKKMGGATFVVPFTLFSSTYSVTLRYAPLILSSQKRPCHISSSSKKLKVVRVNFFLTSDVCLLHQLFGLNAAYQYITTWLSFRGPP